MEARPWKDRGESRAAARAPEWLRIALFVLIGLIGAVFCCGLAGYLVCPNGRVDWTKSSIATVEIGLRLYRDRHGQYPTADQVLRVLVQEKLLDRPPRDAWGNDYRNEGSKYEVLSYGRDGAPGGDGADADIAREGTNETRR